MARVKTISIPDNEIEKYDRAIEGIRERWGFEKDAKIVRESVYQIWEWIEGNKELVRTNQYDTDKREVIDRAYLSGIWNDLRKNVNKNTWKKTLMDYEGFFKQLLFALNKSEMDNERLKMKYEQ